MGRTRTSCPRPKMNRLSERRWSGIAIALLLFVLVLAVPARAYRLNLSLDTRLFFEEYWVKLGDTEQSRRYLGEEISLNLSSYLLDPLLAKYRLGFQLSNLDLFESGHVNNSLNLGYRASTTILPNNELPLTLYMNRVISYHRPEEALDDFYPRYEVITNAYGLKWSILKKSLPQIRMSLDHDEIWFENHPSLSKEDTRTRALLHLLKRAGGSDIRGVFEYEDRENLVARSEYITKRARLEDNTRISPHTSLLLHAQVLRTESALEGEDPSLQDSFDLGTHLHSRPWGKLDTSCRYNFSQSYFNSSTDTVTHLGGASFRYLITSDLETRESLSAIYAKTSQPGEDVTNSTEHGSIGLHYHRSFPWSLLSVGDDLSLGIHQVESGRDGGFVSNHLQSSIIFPTPRLITPSLSFQHTVTRDNSSAGNDQERYRIQLRGERSNYKTLRLYGIVQYEDLREPEAEKKYRDFSTSLNSSLDVWFLGRFNLSLGYLWRDSQNLSSYSYFYRGEYSASFFQRLFFLSSIHQDWEKTEGEPIHHRTAWDSRLGHRVARLLFSLRYYFFHELEGSSENNKHMIYFEIQRGFDWQLGI